VETIMSIWNMHLCSLFKKKDSAKLKSGEVQCPLCGAVVPQSEFLAHAIADDQRAKESRLIMVIKQEHPDWVEADGACPKCLEHYRQTLEAQTLKFRPRTEPA
jgi:hypothetical protein